MKSLIRGNENPNVGSLKHFLVVGVEPPVVPVLYRFRTGSESVLGWYRFDWSVSVPGTGLLLFSNFLLRTVKIVFNWCY